MLSVNGIPRVPRGAERLLQQNLPLGLMHRNKNRREHSDLHPQLNESARRPIESCRQP